MMRKALLAACLKSLELIRQDAVSGLNNRLSNARYTGAIRYLRTVSRAFCFFDGPYVTELQIRICRRLIGLYEMRLCNVRVENTD